MVILLIPLMLCQKSADSLQVWHLSEVIERRDGITPINFTLSVFCWLEASNSITN